MEGADIGNWLTVQEVADRVNAIHPGTITTYAVKNAANRHLPHEDRYLVKKGRMWLIDPVSYTHLTLPTIRLV